MTIFTAFPLRAVALCAASLFVLPAGFAQSANTSPAPAAGANSTKTAAEKDADQMRRWSVYWGWNRSVYSNSDIHFTGVDHDFTLKGVGATDIQTDATWANVFAIYLRPSEITIPQTNMRVAYQWDADTSIALNLDHMKYVVGQGQSVPISGQILGVAQSGNQVIGENWLNYEHTDGLNIVSLELEKQRPVDWFGDSRTARVFALAGVGILVPKTNVTMHMINQVRNDQFHVAGYSVGVGAGFEKDFLKNFFFRSAYKFGYVNMPDVLTSSRGDKASQNFTYNELLIAAGLRF